MGRISEFLVTTFYGKPSENESLLINKEDQDFNVIEKKPLRQQYQECESCKWVHCTTFIGLGCYGLYSLRNIYKSDFIQNAGMTKRIGVTGIFLSMPALMAVVLYQRITNTGFYHPAASISDQLEDELRYYHDKLGWTYPTYLQKDKNDHK